MFLWISFSLQACKIIAQAGENTLLIIIHVGGLCRVLSRVLIVVLSVIDETIMWVHIYKMLLEHVSQSLLHLVLNYDWQTFYYC